MDEVIDGGGFAKVILTDAKQTLAQLLKQMTQMGSTGLPEAAKSGITKAVKISRIPRVIRPVKKKVLPAKSVVDRQLRS